MKNSLMAIFVAILALGLSIGNAEAARLGGSKSVGMQRQSLVPKPATPAQAAPAAPSAPVGAPAATPRRNWLGPLAGLAAGLGIAALLSKFGMGAGMANMLMIALLAMAAVALMSPFQAAPVDLGDTVTGLADLMLTKYVLPFEIAAVLLLVAMIGAIILAKGVDES